MPGHKSRYVGLFRRRREGKTDYKKRRGIIVGRGNFLTARISGRYIHAQVHKASRQGDLTLSSASSSELALSGWKGSYKNLPAAYLTGYLLARRSTGSGVGEAAFYSGVDRFVHGSRIASLLKGARDGGLKVTVDEDSLPKDERTKGQHIADFSKKLEQDDKNAFNRTFSKVISSGLNPGNYPEHFDQVKAAITAAKVEALRPSTKRK